MTNRANIVCLGAGRMGRGIAVAFAYAGHQVTMIDVKARSAEDFAKLEADALGEVTKTFASLSKLGLLTEADVDPLIARVSVVPASQSGAALSEAGMVFEGVPEVVELKREVLGSASRQVRPDTIMASTTSTILVDDLSGAIVNPRRFLNVHWLNPAYLIPLVEVSPGRATDPRHRRRGQGTARRHRQGPGRLRGDARLHRSAHPGAGDERGRTHGRGRRRQCR
ncbi:3-hydroxyacyl-CoA dehydrogenase [Bradyrhizobium ottawaense]